MDLLGKKWTVHDLAGELVKDRVYFDQSGGGVTLSGGEAALQHEFCLALLKELRSRRIQTALDTCGQVPQAVLESLLPYVDILLYDLKLIDPVQHKAWTGSNNERILANAAFVAAYKKTHRSPKTVWMRTPVIPDATDTEENIRGLGEFIQANLRGCVSRWELCAFNNLCRDKYERMGLDWPFAETPLPERSRMEALAQTAKSAVSASIVCWSGATRLEPDAKGRCTPARENKTISVPGSSKWTKGGLSWPK
jgi:pyruvate formate lyase activating enzyme